MSRPSMSAEPTGPLRDTGTDTADSDARYALVMQSIGFGAYEWDIVNDTVHYTPVLRVMLGLSSVDLATPGDWLARIHADDLPLYRRALVEHLKGETPRFDCELRYRNGTGAWRWARQTGIARRDESGRAIKLTGATGDITEAKEHERELSAARNEVANACRDVALAHMVMQTVLDNMNDGVLLFDRDFCLQFFNAQFIDMQGYPPDICRTGVSGHDLLRFQAARGDFGSTDDVDRTARERAALVKQPSGAHYKRRTAAGGELEFNFKVLSDGGLLVVCRDITELKDRETALADAKAAAEAARDRAERARADAEAANQSKSTFLATMSHEIRTPMNGVLGMIEVLESQGLKADQRRSVAIMRESAVSLLGLIDDVLDFSKIEAGRLDLEETAFSLSGLVEGVAATFGQPASAKGLRLEVDVAPGSNDAVIGDPTRLRQILVNLIGNAIKFTERGHVAVRALIEPRAAGEVGLVLSVTDTGIGLDDNERLRLFQPFAQADSSTTRRFGGTGLGLSIVRRLAQLMGGDVAVDSAPGRGSAFTVTVTLRAAPADNPLNTMLRAPSRRARAKSRTARPRVLVVDDHPVNREVMVRQLDLLGIAADTVNDGVTALQAWTAGRYAAILADIHMPRMDGHEFTGRLRATESSNGGARTPVVAVTANAVKGEEERCLDAGMDAYLAKPVRLEQLRATLERWLPIDDGRRSGAPRPAPDGGIDLDSLASWLGDDREAIRSLMDKFCETAVESERDIAAASRTGDLAALAAAAHKLKGAAQMVGADGIGDVAARLEHAGKAGDRARCRDALGPLAVELRQVLAHIAAMDRPT
jgi:signal transduction histidine kinase/HPt (histidine-containing phosphotransfer) domain-containing protein/ActR/RegA family two-component response regulator